MAIDVYRKVLSDELNRFPRNFWTGPNGLIKAAEITRYLLEDILRWESEEIKISLNLEIFRKYRLGGMLMVLFSASPYGALDNAYNDKYKPWEMSKCPINTWSIESACEALRWMLEVKYKYTKEEICDEFGYEFITKNKLSAPYRLFENEYEYIDSVYPNQYKPWDFRQCPVNFWWNDSNKLDAIKWLVEECLELEVKDTMSLSHRDFIDNNLGGLLVLFNNSWRGALKLAYPFLEL